ncbi:MAG: ATP-binding cassette domain-containing protein, partial [Dehalococcoidia bacterium]|nr:ATP-binding cassette domain-containing protein [Dehalococcoidia bacterium]
MLNNRTVHSHDTKLKTKNVSLFYGTFQALRTISLDISKQSITAIIGPSGCGKSSFLRLFNRMNDLIIGARVDGAVAIDDINIYDRDIDVVELRKRVGMVFQKPNPFPMSVFENVAFGPRRHGRTNRGELESIVERSLRQAALWDEVKDKLG